MLHSTLNFNQYYTIDKTIDGYSFTIAIHRLPMFFWYRTFDLFQYNINVQRILKLCTCVLVHVLYVIIIHIYALYMYVMSYDKSMKSDVLCLHQIWWLWSMAIGASTGCSTALTFWYFSVNNRKLWVIRFY